MPRLPGCSAALLLAVAGLPAASADATCRAEGAACGALGDGTAVEHSLLMTGLAVQRRSEQLQGLGYITHPRPVTLEEMRSVDTTDMVANTFLDHHVIYSYPSAEDQFVSGSLASSHEWEGTQVSRVCEEFQNVKGRADFVDVGANIGTYSIPLAVCLQQRGHGGKVIAVEGLPSIAKHLEASVARNGLEDTVDVYNYAVGDGKMKANSVKMNLAPTNKGGSSILGNKPKGLVEGGDVQDGPVVESKVTTLDSILQRGEMKHRKIFAMKMDVEGSEGHALRGARQLLSEAPPCILQLELNVDWLKRAGTPRETVLDILRQAGYVTPETIEGEMVTTSFRQKDFEACRSRFAD